MQDHVRWDIHRFLNDIQWAALRFRIGAAQVFAKDADPKAIQSDRNQQQNDNGWNSLQRFPGQRQDHIDDNRNRG